MLATLLLSQGTPMLLAGDEIGNSQQGNNNAYCQDNEISWIDWSFVDHDLLAFTKQMIAFRKSHPILHQKRFLHSRERLVDGIEDLFWWREDGAPMDEADWTDGNRKTLCAEMRTVSGTPAYAAHETAIFSIFNAGDAVRVTIPNPPDGMHWVCKIDTSDTDHPLAKPADGRLDCPADSVVVLVLEPDA